jgi:hypothetical protein
VYAPTCPECGEPIDGNGDCTACDWYEGKEPEPFDDVDLLILHSTLTAEYTTI